jgi:hypothetical protein
LEFGGFGKFKETFGLWRIWNIKRDIWNLENLDYSMRNLKFVGFGILKETFVIWNIQKRHIEFGEFGIFKEMYRQCFCWRAVENWKQLSV